MEYSLPYIAFLSILGICTILFEYTEDEKKKWNITAVAITVFYVFFAFRGYVYSDWTSYAALLKDVEWSDIFIIHKDNAVVIEPGFTLLCCLCAVVTREYAFLVIVITTIDLVLFLRFLKHWEIRNVAFAMMMLVSFEGVEMMFNLLRNQVAIFIFLNSLDYIIKRKPLPYFLLCLSALSFHLSSLLFFPLYFFLNRRINKWVYALIFFSFLLFFFSKVSLATTIINLLNLEGPLAEKAAFYTENLTVRRTISIASTLEQVMLIGLIVAYYNRITESFRGGICVINSLLLFFFFYFIFAEFKEFSTRLAILFVFSYWIIWIYLFKSLNLESNKIMMVCVLFMYCGYMSIHRYYKPIQEYDNLLFGAKSQVERQKIFNKTFETDE
jgi:hypothetical protein